MALEAAQRLRHAIDDAVASGEVGLQVAAYVGDRLVVDVAVGRMAEGDAPSIDRSTVFPVFSVSKAITATAVHIQAERGLVDYDRPLANYWPEYGQRGKNSITVAQVLSHRAGVPQMPPDVTPALMTDWEWMVRRLGELEPLFAPGTRNTYQSMTFGWLLGELVRRTDPTQRPFGLFVAEEICAPLGMDSFWLGVPEAALPRVATLSESRPRPVSPPGSVVLAAVPESVGLVPKVFNRPDVQRACIPAVGGVGNALSVARFFAMLANGGSFAGARVLAPERVASFLNLRPRGDEPDETYGRPMPVGACGFWLEAPEATGARILCHPGAGGTIGWADLDRGLAVAICHNRMFYDPAESPFGPIADAARAVAAEHVA